MSDFIFVCYVNIAILNVCGHTLNNIVKQGDIFFTIHALNVKNDPVLLKSRLNPSNPFIYLTRIP